MGTCVTCCLLNIQVDLIHGSPQVLIGEPGVGKTAIVEGLAQRIVKVVGGWGERLGAVAEAGREAFRAAAGAVTEGKVCSRVTFP
jgi:MoxR-like ATPase